MTSNEKKILTKFKEIKKGNTVTIAGMLRVTINYAYDMCKKLCEKGYLERLSPGRFALYRITPLGEKQVKTESQTKEEEATERSEEVPPPVSRSPECNEGSVVEGSDSVDEKRGFLNHPSVPRDWKTCNWKWK